MAVPAQPCTTASIELGEERRLEVETDGATTRIRVRSALVSEQIEFELCFTAEGPVVRTRAAALELDAATAITARCTHFTIAAEGDIDLQAGGQLRCRASEATIDASPGAVRLRANDDVQLLGELVLLNCDRLPPLPDWVPPQRHQPSSLPPNAVLGDPEVVAALLGGDTDGTEP
jgi:nitrite reductase/ring-hydroxylating ferredoxin subunit